MKLKFISIICVLIAISIARAKSQNSVTVAVYNFTSDGGTDYGSQITALITADLSTETNLVMLERAELNKALSEQAFGISGMVNSEAAAKIGQLTGAKVLVAGQVIKTTENHLIIVVDIIGTETGRLFAKKVEGTPEGLTALTSDLSGKIAQLISAQRTNLTSVPIESREDRLNRIVKSVAGTNRPSISLCIYLPHGSVHGKRLECRPVETELGAILLKAGFSVVDDNSDRKPDIEIVGASGTSFGPRHGALFSCHTTLEVKIQERRSGKIIAFEQQESTATDVGRDTASRLARSNSADDLMKKILPVLAQ